MTLSLLLLPAAAVDFNWSVAGPADWSDGANWDQGGAIPGGGGGNHARINNGGIAVLNEDIANLQDIFVGSGAGTSGTLNHTGGTTQLPDTQNGWMFVGNAGGTGTVNQSGGVNTKERLYFGRADGGADSNGTFNLSGNGLVNNGGEVSFGVDGNGSTGTGLFTGNGRIQTGLFQVANGSVNVTDNASVDAAGEFWVGQGGGNTGVLVANSGSLESDSWIAIGRDGSTGTMTLSGTASLNKTGNAESFITLGGLGTGGGGTLNVQDDATITSISNLLIAETGGRNGIVNQSGGTITVVDNTVRTSLNAGGTARPEPSVRVDAGGGGLGEYHLSGGTLNAETVEVGAGTFDMTGGVLAVTAFEGDLVQKGGTLSPGASPGITSIIGNYILQVAGDLFIELNGLTAGTEYDQVSVTGDIDLAGSLILDVGFNPAEGDSFTIIDNQGTAPVTGAFAEGSSIATAGGQFLIDYAGGDGNDVTLTFTAVPEPSTSLLGLAALLAFVGRRRRG